MAQRKLNCRHVHAIGITHLLVHPHSARVANRVRVLQSRRQASVLGDFHVQLEQVAAMHRLHDGCVFARYEEWRIVTNVGAHG